MSTTFDFCDTSWGTHGCELEPGHDGPHLCGCPECERAGLSYGPDAIFF